MQCGSVSAEVAIVEFAKQRACAGRHGKLPRFLMFHSFFRASIAYSVTHPLASAATRGLKSTGAEEHVDSASGVPRACLCVTAPLACLSVLLVPLAFFRGRPSAVVAIPAARSNEGPAPLLCVVRVCR